MNIGFDNMNFGDLLRFGLASYSIGMVAQNIFRYIKENELIKQVSQIDVKRWSQVKGKIKQEEGKMVLIKDTIKDQRTLQCIFQVGSNQQLFKILPRYRMQIARDLNTSQFLRDKQQVRLKQYPYQFKLPQLTTSNLIQLSPIYYQSIFSEGKDSPGIFTTIFKYALATISALAEMFLVIFNRNRGDIVLVKGPVWGELCLYSYIVDAPLVFLCQIKNSRLRPFIAGFSKGEIISYLENNKLSLLFGISLGLFQVYLNRGYFRRIFGRIFKIWAFIWEKLKESIFYKSKKDNILKKYAPQVRDEQTCIICYKNCRNVIFRKCNHLVICSDCIENLENMSDSCPMCRVNLDGDFIKVVAQKEAGMLQEA